MPDVPQKRTSLAEMARVAAQKSLRPPPTDAPAPVLTPPPSSVRGLTPPPPQMFPSAPPAPPPGSMRTGDSGMIHLHELTSSPAIEPEIIAAAPVPSSSTAGVQVDRRISSRPAPKARRGMSWLLVAGVVVLTGAAAAGVAAKKGLTARGAAQRIMAVFKPAPAGQPIAPFQLDQEHAAPAVAVAPPGPAQPAAQARPEPAVPVAGNAATPGADKHPAAMTHPAGKVVEKTAAQPKAAEIQVPTVPEKQAPTSANPLANAMQKAAGSQANDVPPPAARVDTGPSDVPEIPPQGAILGALGAKRQAAKACVRGLTEPSRATIVFASSGKVQSVSVSGAAAGLAAEGCLKKTFMAVSVEPFRRATYTSSTAITP